MNTKLILASKYLAVAVLFTIRADAARGGIDGDALNGLCGDIYRVTDTARCEGYAEGIADVMRGGDSIAGYRACIGNTTTDKQLLSEVEDYLRDAADEGADPAARLVAKALMQLYPCRH
jgi:hypothetical protein